MQKWEPILKKYLVIGTLLVLLITNFSAVLAGLQVTIAILRPVIAGAAMAYIVNLFVKRYERLETYTKVSWIQRARRPLAIVLSYLTILIVISLIIGIVIPQLSSVLVRFIESVPIMRDQFQDWMDKSQEFFPQVQDFLKETNFSYDEIFTNISNYANNVVQSIAKGTVAWLSSMTSNIFDGFVAIVMSVYLVSSKDVLREKFQRVGQVYLSQASFLKLRHFLQLLDDSFESYFIGSAIDGMILGTMVTLGMWVFGFPFALMIGILTAVSAFVPYIGALVAGLIGTLLIGAQDPMQGLLFGIFIIVVQQIESNLIYPRVVGDSIGLPGLWVLVSLTIFGGLFGLVGMVIGIPTLATFYKILAIDVKYREHQESDAQPLWLESLTDPNLVRERLSQ